MPSMGGALSGAASGAAIGSFFPVIGTGVGAVGGGILGGLFSGSGKSKNADAIDENTKLMQGLSDSLKTSGTNLSTQGANALAPALSYLTKLVGGDTAAAMDATRPQRARVIDQYDAARKSIAEFAPRGGGTASVLAESRFKEAGDLANLTSQARTDAVGQLSDIGQKLASLGINTQGMSADLQAKIAGMLSDQDAQKRQSDSAAGAALGQLLGAIIMAKGNKSGAAVYG